MFALTRWTILIVLIVLSGVLTGFTVAIAQSPAKSDSNRPEADDDLPLPELPDRIDLPLPQLELPAVDAEQLDLPELDSPPDARTLEKIEKMIEGSSDLEAESGDSILQGLQEYLRQRGSLTDRFPSSVEPIGQIDEEVAEPVGGAGRFVAAELLLKTSRKLERIEPSDPIRRKLVKQMRCEAVRLLSE